jgi:hypothetical protein
MVIHSSQKAATAVINAFLPCHANFLPAFHAKITQITAFECIQSSFCFERAEVHSKLD